MRVSSAAVLVLLTACRAAMPEPVVQVEEAPPPPPAAQKEPEPEAEPEEPAPEEPEQTEAVDAPAVPTLAELGPFYAARIQEGWLVISAEADFEEWRRLQEVSSDPLWAGNGALPQRLQTFPPIHVVWREGVVSFESFARAGIGEAGWDIHYRARRVRGPALAMEKAPPEGTRLAPGAKPRNIQRKHPMAERLRELLEQGGRGSRPVPLRGYALQETPGRFGDATSIVVVSAWAPPPPDDSVGEEASAVFTTNDAGEAVVHIGLFPHLVQVAGVLDVDGDEVDEILVSTHGYEFGSEDLYRLGPDGVERVNLLQVSH